MRLRSLTAVKLRKLQKIHNKIIQRQLQMRIIKKNLKKDMNLHKEGIINELRLKYYNNGMQKAVEATGDLIGNRITGVSKISETYNKDNQTIFKTSMLRTS